MPRILTKLRIDEISAVDKGAGHKCKVILMKRDDDTRPRSKPHLERYQRRLRREQYERSFNGIMAKADADGDEIDRNVRNVRDSGSLPDGGGNASDHHASKVADLLVEAKSHPDRSAALGYLLHSPHGQALLQRMHKADQTAKEFNMRSETLESILKDSGPVSVCKGIVARGRSPCDEAQLVAVLTQHAGGDRGFAKLYETEPDVRRACSIAKAAELSVFDIEPMIVGGPDAMNSANDDTEQSAVLLATKEIQRIGREKFPFLSADQQFARVFEDKNYSALAAQAHRRPGPTTVYAMPKAAAYTKSDSAPNADSAYAELMLKAEAYRSAHPELSVAQCFEKIYTNRANIELAKRERIESAPR
jgi:hypothetical protein